MKAVRMHNRAGSAALVYEDLMRATGKENFDFWETKPMTGLRLKPV